MEMQTLYLLDWDWLVHVYYEVEAEDAEEVLDDLRSIGCRGTYLARAVKKLRRCRPNEGLTYTSNDDRASVVFLTRTTSAAEFQDSFDHEKGHLAMHICLAEDINPFSEEYQYLTGEIGKQMFSFARKYMCDYCRKKEGRA